MKLYEIPSELRVIEAQIADADGELTPELEAALDALETQFEEKAEYLALLIREAQVEADAYKAEETRLRDRRRAAENRADRLKRYVHEQMQRMGKDKVRGQLASLSVVANSRPSVVWAEGVEIPDAFSRIKRELDANAVLTHVGIYGEPPEGATLVQGTHLRVR